jgi:dTDP-4-amino-4,6-dideoxygalactose transaminase
MIKPFKEPIYVTRPLIPDYKKYDLYSQHVFQSKQFSNNGNHLLQLESKLKSYLKVENNAAFCNGTVALMIALKSLDLKGSVVTTPFTFPATTNALLWTNLEPIFCDIDYYTMNIIPEEVEKCIEKDTTAILPVHVFGIPCDVYGFKKLADVNNLKLIYDAAHAFGVEYNNVGIGNFGDISMFSFHPTKLFHTGEGGMLTYNNHGLDIIIKRLRNFGIHSDGVTGSVLPGINGKMSEIQAVMGLCILDEIHKEQNKRWQALMSYSLGLLDVPWIKFLSTSNINNVKPSFQYLPIRIIGKSRDEICNRLNKYNVFPRKYFHPLCSDFKHIDCKKELPNAKRVSEEILCLPFYGDLTADNIEKICAIITDKN